MGNECCNEQSSSSGGHIQLKADYVGNMETKFAEIGAKMDELTAKAHDAKESAAVKYEQLKKRREEAAAKLHLLKNSTGEAWTEFRSGVDKAFDELKLAWDELRSGSEKAVAKFEK